MVPIFLARFLFFLTKSCGSLKAQTNLPSFVNKVSLRFYLITSLALYSTGYFEHLHDSIFKLLFYCLIQASLVWYSAFKQTKSRKGTVQEQATGIFHPLESSGSTTLLCSVPLDQNISIWHRTVLVFLRLLLSGTKQPWPYFHDLGRCTCLRCSLRAILRLPFLRFNISQVMRV